MKKTVFASVALVICIFILASCGEPVKRTGIVADGAGEYSIVRAETIRDEGKLSLTVKLMNRISDAVEEKCGCQLVIDTDWLKRGTEPDPEKKEILIGETNRPETAEAIGLLGDAGYGVIQIGNKIVIVGKSDYMLSLAVERFIKECVETHSSAKEGSFDILGAIDYVGGDFDDLIDLGTYDIVYTRDYEDPYAYSYYDYSFDEQTVAKDLADSIKENYGIKLPVVMDYDRGDVENERGILLGRCERAETAEVKSSLAFNEYAVKVVNNKVVVAGHGFLSTYAAINKLEELIGTFAVTENGKTRVFIPKDFSYVGVLEGAENWDLEVPRYEGGGDFSVSDLGDDSYIVKIDGTDGDEYSAYVKKIEEIGYEKYSGNEIEGNLFAVYKNEKSAVHLQYAPAYKRVSIAVEPATVTLFGREAENDTTAVTTPKLIQLSVYDENIENGGMCYILRLENGKFLIVDSGQQPESAELIYEQLQEYNAHNQNHIRP